MTALESDVQPLTGPTRALDSRVRLVWAGQALVTALVVAGVVGTVAYALEGLLWPAALVFLVAVTLGVTHAHLRYRRWSYRVRESSLSLDRGVLTRVRTVVPYVRVQHIDTRRGPLERATGLATLVVYTAGSRGADVTIPGLTPGDAADLQTRLERLAIAAEGEEAV
ncbi:PH domain-containing protein [Halomarina ordinaria]|uniref:PH domain-containing protein n=1 Tax=Halomarina ordinaria TaxID=3033939 RepID=A0ABD5U5T6_9EURY|nr:PH domain-containing protein [Halomarina sp. PSRA2]